MLGPETMHAGLTTPRAIIRLRSYLGQWQGVFWTGKIILELPAHVTGIAASIKTANNLSVLSVAPP